MRPKLILVAANVILASGVGIFIRMIQHKQGTNATGCLGAWCLFLGLVLMDVYRLKPSKRHTVRTLFQQYIHSKILLFVRIIMQWKWLRLFKDSKKQQAGLLERILNQNRGTLFAQENGLSTIRTVEEFRSNMPLTRYGHYEKYVDMITEHGTQNVMFPFKVDYIALTSGTSKGKSKGYPKSNKIRSNLMPTIIFAVQQTNEVPGCGYLKRIFNMVANVQLKKTSSGIDQGPVSFFVTGKDPPSYLLVPKFMTTDEKTNHYVYLVFGLAEDDLTGLAFISSTVALAVFTMLKQNWQRLCDDVERGRLSSALKIDDGVRTMLNKRLRKDPDRAEFLRSEFKQGFVNIVRRIWPQCSVITAMRTGSFKTQTKILRERYTGDLPIASIIHGGTEAAYGVNWDVLADDVHYTLAINQSFFEFVPEEDMDQESPPTFLAHQLEIGKNYEIVVTTLEGLYRYRTEDVIQVTRYRDTAPVYEFIRRAGDILSASFERVPEVLLHQAVTTAARDWTNNAVIDFTSVENIAVENVTGDVTGTSFYIVFLEMAEDDTISDTEKSQVDQELCSRHERYSVMRTNDRLKPVRVVQVKAGTFDKVKTHMLTSNEDAFFMQYKLPRITRRADVLKLLLDQTL